MILKKNKKDIEEYKKNSLCFSVGYYVLNGGCIIYKIRFRLY